MRIINETQWETRDLRNVFSLVLAKWNVTDDKKVPSKRLKHVKVVNSRSRGPSGCAYLHSGWMHLRLPKPEVWKWREVEIVGEAGQPVLKSERYKGPNELDVKQVGFLFEHELAHCAGYNHDRMGPLNHWEIAKSSRYDYLGHLSIQPRKKREPKPKADPVLVRQARAQAALKRWTTKLKRAQTEVKKAQRTLKYYERALAKRPGREVVTELTA